MRDKDKTKRRIIDYRMIWRWHFYAGLFCIPFVIILSITGPIYLFKPQIEAMIDRPYDHIARTGRVQPLSAQVEGALAAFPNATFQAVEVRQDRADAARVILSEDGEKLRVYVHPENLMVLKSVKDEDRFMNIIKTIHGELVMGQFGTLLVELAASWALVMIITGLYLWWPRERTGLAGVLWPRLSLGRKVFWRDLHGVTGIYVSFFAVVLLLTGLPWTTVWGAGFKTFRQAVVAQPADWSTSRAADKAAGHEGHVGHENPAASSIKGLTDLTFINPMVETLRAADLPPSVMMVAPAKGKPWQGVSQTPNRPQAVTVTFDPMGDIERVTTFGDKPLIDQVVGVGIAAHEGQLFGVFNQILGLLTALGLITLCVSAVVMWWQRRPDPNRLGTPLRLPDERLGVGLEALIVGLGLFLPMMGLCLISVGLLEFLVLRRIVPVRDWLGLR
ncbi:PepSY domain-containing protein [Asticcacaulis sp. YBE204]|uniref:PepSY-associated TM helix domain-containing protein n=1 Tax=Asticcacaulis sp. YBE204 TaxID=1282363 RepID=UPI0003C3F9D5|nr:PepSY domain-containing protein [Asticcacaulis sp. YBE204]ESQ78113.1 hypothetical protein AEYBE204_14815 [Asticcacaulis sp. YBE204]